MIFFKNKNIYTKGYEKKHWLQYILETNKVYNLEDIECPNFETLYINYSSDIQTCIYYHNNIWAYKNAFCLYKWCKEERALFL